jgi:hypothetical protein
MASVGAYDEMRPYACRMFVRLRWFIYGSVVTMILAVIAVRRARAIRERIDADGVVRVAAVMTADGVEAIGRRLQRSALRVAPDGSRTGAG